MRAISPLWRRTVAVFASAIAWLVCSGVASAQTTGLGVYQPGDENQIWQQLSYVGSATCTVDPNTGNCTTTPDTSLGKYYYPIQITTDVLSAASGRTTTCAADNRVINYVTDQWNNRVQAFDFCGNPVAFPNAPNGWPTIGGGPAGGTMAAGSGPTGLTNPEGIAVDAAHHIIIGDRDNSRVAIFNEDGSFLFDIAVPSGTEPTGVAVFPGTVMDSTGAGQGWLAVTLSAYGSSQLQVYDSTGNFIAQNPEAEGSGLPGALSGPSDLVIDASGRVYVADLYNSRIAAYQVDTTAASVTYQFQFGAPADPSNLQPADLQYPYSVALDQLGRLIVGDTVNQRLAIFTVSFAAPATPTNPTITYQFYLDARGDLNGYPRGIAQDRDGRLYSVDTTNHRIQRFETPSLAVINASTSPASVPSGGQFTVTAGVVVPASKVAVTNVVPTLSASSNVTYVSGPTPVAPATAIPTPLIDPGQVAYYTWTYIAGTAGGTATFTIGASGDPNSLGATTAPTKSLGVPLGCSGCETTPPTTTPVVTSAQTYSYWHSSPVTVTLTAVDAANVGTPSGIREIRVRLSGAESSTALGLPQCSIQYDGNIEYCVTPSSSTISFSTSLSLTTDGSTTVWFRSVDNNGNVEAQNSTTVVIDSNAPIVNFTPTVAPNANGWYGASTASVTVNYTVVDSESGLPASVPASGTLTFSQEGDITQSFTVADNVGNGYTASFDVKIDRTPPTITPIPAQTVELATTAGTRVTLTPTATDALSGLQSITTNAPAIFPLGTNSVTITATDRAGNVATSTTSVTVRDTTPPVFVVVPVPVTLSTTATSATAAMPNLAALAVATDLEAVTITQSTPVGTALYPGHYTVTLTATDAAGNQATASVSVTVRDLTPPTTTATIASAQTYSSWHSSPATVSLTAIDGANIGTPSGLREIRVRLSGAESSTALGLPQCAVQYDSNIDYCISAPASTVSYSTSLPIVADGTTTVWFRSVDNSGNVEAQKSTTVVVDSNPPVVTFTPAVPPNANGWYGASTASVAVNYAVSDSESGLPSTVPASGALTFTQEGITTQTVNVVDNVGNASAATDSVQIDRTPPTITPIAAQTVELSTPSGTPLTLALAATDALSGVQSVTSNAPAVFPLGTTTVTITATDRAGNVSTATTTVTVRDTTPPVFTVVPAPVTVATSPTVGTGAMPNLAALAAATDFEAVTITQSTPVGTALNPGVYTVTLTATDAAGNKSTTTASVTVRDLTPPTITACAPAATVSINPTTNLATVPNLTGGVTAIDNGGGLLSTTQTPAAGTTLALGTYPVTFAVADTAGNVASCSSTLNVLSVPPPTATIVVLPGVLWPPNHKMVPITATLTISDPNATVQLVSITSSEPDNGLGDGDRPIDEQTLTGNPISTAYGTDTRQFLLRAERSGTGPGRVYTVTYKITNAAGSVTVSGVVLVPHDMGNDDGRDDDHNGDHNGDRGGDHNGDRDGNHDGDHGGTHGQIGDGHFPGDGHDSCWANKYPDLWRIANQRRDGHDDDRDSRGGSRGDWNNRDR